MEMDLTNATWRKSTYSNGSGGSCCECTYHRGVVAVRDSKHPDGPKLIFALDKWRAFTEEVKLS
jgi:hypothetical protein